MSLCFFIVIWALTGKQLGLLLLHVLEKHFPKSCTREKKPTEFFPSYGANSPNHSPNQLQLQALHSSLRKLNAHLKSKCSTEKESKHWKSSSLVLLGKQKHT